MNTKSALRSIPFFGAIARKLKRWGFKNSADYWERRYQAGGNSGAGSYNRLAEFKAKILNEFVQANGVSTVIEFGSGDGAQLELAEYPSYVGVDVSQTAIDASRARFANDSSKAFFRSSDLPPNLTAELALSLDVIYHLVEDQAFERYMRGLFDAATKFVIIYSSNHDERLAVPHVRHRHFSEWIERKRSNFRLLRRVPNAYSFDASDPDNTSFADFYIYQRS